MVSCLVIEEGSLVGYLSLSVCLLLRLWKWQTAFGPVAPNVPLAGLLRGSVNKGSRSIVTAERVAFLWFGREGQVGLLQVCLLLAGGSRRRQLCVAALSPPSPLPPPLSALSLFQQISPLNAKEHFEDLLGRNYFWVLSQGGLLHFLLCYLEVSLIAVPSFSKSSLVCGTSAGLTKGSAYQRGR